MFFDIIFAGMESPLSAARLMTPTAEAIAVGSMQNPPERWVFLLRMSPGEEPPPEERFPPLPVKEQAAMPDKPARLLTAIAVSVALHRMSGCPCVTVDTAVGFCGTREDINA